MQDLSQIADTKFLHAVILSCVGAVAAFLQKQFLCDNLLQKLLFHLKAGELPLVGRRQLLKLGIEVSQCVTAAVDAEQSLGLSRLIFTRRILR